MVRDWSRPQYPLNSLLVNLPAQYGAMDEFLGTLIPGAYMGGVDLQDCFLHWLVAPSCRRCLGVRHPLTGVLGVYLFLPVGSGPSPGINDGCVRAVLEVVRAHRPCLRIVDFVDDIRLVGTSGEHDALAASMTNMLAILGRMASVTIRRRARGGGRHG